MNWWFMVARCLQRKWNGLTFQICLFVCMVGKQYSFDLSFSLISFLPDLLPVQHGALEGLQNRWDSRVSLPAYFTSGCIVLNLPARWTDEARWWIRGVTIHSPAYLLQHGSCFMWSLYMCVNWICERVCSPAHTLDQWVFAGESEDQTIRRPKTHKCVYTSTEKKSYWYLTFWTFLIII